MSTPRHDAPLRLSWTEREDKKNREDSPKILRQFWTKYIEGRDSKQIAESVPIKNIKDMFLRGMPPSGVSREEWEKQVDAAWTDQSAFTSLEKFSDFFKHIPSLRPVALAERLLPVRPESKFVKITSDDLYDLRKFTTDRKFSVSTIFGSVEEKQLKSCCSEDYTTTDIFSLQSVGKVFTGILALILLKEVIITPEDLERKNIPLNDSIKELLVHAPAVLRRLEQVTLHQALTHLAGLPSGNGDFVGEYDRAIEQNSKLKIRETKDLLQFVPDQVSNIGEWTYSNTGILLAGLALEHLYNQCRVAHPERELPELNFNGLIERYIIKPAEMLHFSFHPPADFKYNTEVKSAKHVVGSPAGGAYASAEDLERFGRWLYQECHSASSPNLTDFIDRYGQEFSNNQIIAHRGDSPSGSSYFSLSLATGNMVIVLNDQHGGIADEIGNAIKAHVFSVQRPSFSNLQADFRYQSEQEQHPNNTRTVNVPSVVDPPSSQNSATPATSTSSPPALKR